MYKILNSYAAPNLKESIFFQNTYNLRNNDADLTRLKPKREFLKISFKYSGAMLWNNLSQEAKSSETLQSFKGELQPKISLLHMKVLTLIKAKSNVFL